MGLPMLAIPPETEHALIPVGATHLAAAGQD